MTFNASAVRRNLASVIKTFGKYHLFIYNYLQLILWPQSMREVLLQNQRFHRSPLKVRQCAVR
jgi:hypothetical protein